MSDERMEEKEKTEGEDVEAHGFDQPVDAPHAGATEEPPDVEGHQMGGRPIDPRPID